MGNRSIDGHESGANGIIEEVWYAGTDALKEGEGLCYNTDFGTATERNGRRGNHVERPSRTNHYAFAGVLEHDYKANSTGQFVRIFVPGSKGVNVALGVDTVIGTGVLTFTAGTAGSHRGRFTKAGFKGRGTIVPRQTVTAVIESDMAGGTWLLATDGVTLTVASTTDLAAGDTVVFVGGEVEDGGGVIVPGKHIISSITDATTLVLTSTAVTGTQVATLYCTGYAYTGNPKCQADLLEGEESGGVEFLSPTNAALVGLTYMAGGVSYICGGGTLAGDNDITFAQGLFEGQQKAFYCLGALTTNDFTLDLATNGVRLDGSTTLTDVEGFDAAADQWTGVFYNLRWRTQGVSGATEA